MCKEGLVYLINTEYFYSDLGLYIYEMQEQEVAVLCCICDVVCTAMKAVCRKVQSAKEQSGNTVHCKMKCVTSLLM